MNARWEKREHNEQATAEHLRGIGCEVLPYGQDLLSEAARELLRGDPNAWPRWLADFIVRTPGQDRLLVDAKFALPGTLNHSIEMRSLWAARREGLPVWYVCSFYDPTSDKFVGFKAIDAATVPTGWPCCFGCATAYETQMITQLPVYCPIQEQNSRGSRTPFFVVKPGAFPDVDPFGIRTPAGVQSSPPCRVCGGLVLPGGRWADVHPACKQWSNSGHVYGPSIYADTVAATGIDPSRHRIRPGANA
jgi:hypothetical protein